LQVLTCYQSTLSNALRMAYIDSEMAKRRPQSTNQNTFETSTVVHDLDTAIAAKSLPSALSKEQQHQHQLAEVDLPPDAAKLPPLPKRQRKPRLGRNGKPLPPRKPKRRDSGDLARDALVEQVLHEHRLDHYKPPTAVSATTPPAAETHSSSVAAQSRALSSTTVPIGSSTRDDEAFALRFQREFEEGLAERQAMQRKPQKKTGKEAEKDVASSGPRLGGSRSARAKMHAMWEAEKEKEKGRLGGTAR
jgi:hypothetical protein